MHLTKLWSHSYTAFGHLRSLGKLLIVNNEPQVHLRVSKSMQPIWDVYLPQTQQRYHFYTEAEVRCWLDTIHHH